jgi:antitoxin PrlF
MTKPEDERDRWERPADVPPDQEWFWTPEWIAGEREADADLAAGRSKVFYSDEEFLAYLDGFDKATEEPAEQPGQ